MVTVMNSSLSPNQRLQWLHAALSQHVRRYQRQYSAVLLGRVGRGEELWGPQQPTIMDVMKDDLTSLQEQNLQLCELFGEEWG